MTTKHNRPGPWASARSNPPHGHKAVIIHPHPYTGEKGRTEVLARRGYHGIGKNFPTRAEAIVCAEKTIAARAALPRRRLDEYNERHARWAAKAAESV